MSEPVLTDEEKGALLDGMSSGEVEVHSTGGPTYAEVKPFDVGPRSRIVTNSYPRLQSLNRQFASRAETIIENLLNCECSVTFNHVANRTFSEFGEIIEGLTLLLEFDMKPLEGAALMNLNADLVETLVETFYGGAGNDRARDGAEFFTPGEINVARLFGNAVMSVIAEVWQPMIDLKPEFEVGHLSSSIIDCIDVGDSIISTEFDLQIGDTEQHFHLLWPVTTVAPLVPVFDGQKRERDTAEDARWHDALRGRVIDAVINVASHVGRTQMALKEVAELKPGDVIMIANPQRGIVHAQRVPVLEGRFGVHDGRYAIETRRWLDSEPGGDAARNA
ncbi:MAG: FliM/FliN family flagellar motor switch protein [Woeseiaceae bacterium]|nr:FliM/FliN family flagellar motor switch protein [Woeseiaceae bacterium]